MFRRKPSPATALSLIALFVALGGTTYAAATIGSGQVRNNSLRSADIRNNSLSSKDIKNRSLRGVDIRGSTITGGKVRNRSLRGSDLLDGSVLGADLAPNSVDGSKVVDNGLSGADVDEGSLGTVPSAANAQQLGGRGPDSFEPAAKTIRLGLVRLGDGDSRELARTGPLTFTGTCDLDNGGNDGAAITVTTSLNNSAVDGSLDDADLDAGETTAIVNVTSAANTPAINEPDETTAAAPDGTIVGGNPLFAAVNTLDGDCVVGGTLALG